MGSKQELTHKHRNLIDDILDGTLAAIAIAYFFLSAQFDIHLTDQTMALIATAGATLRGAARKILIHLWGQQLGITEGAEDAHSAAVASSDAESED